MLIKEKIVKKIEKELKKVAKKVSGKNAWVFIYKIEATNIEGFFYSIVVNYGRNEEDNGESIELEVYNKKWLAGQFLEKIKDL